ncbi:short-chain dehydrogenase [Duganella caerulea]|uniref:SDR family oxidoreductase n=1 Tax=Duganella caerulea TaxID=2885762 RepID=UPI0030E936D9
MKKILIIGASSAIAQAAARQWAAQGHALYLLGRDEERLAALAADLAVRGAPVARHGLLDVNEFALHAAAIDAAAAALGGLDTVLIAHGTLGDQKLCEQDFAAALRELNTNAISVMSLLTLLANRFEAQRHGTLAVIGSVAGDRGRQSNYVYGTAKGALAIFLQGLRNRLHPAGVRVLTVKPGFVDTPMTASFKKGPLWATPEAVAAAIVAAVERGRDVIYTPWFWWGIMTLIKLVPERVFKKLKL